MNRAVGTRNCSIGTRPSDLYPKSTMASLSVILRSSPCSNFPLRGRRKMAVIIQQLRVVLFRDREALRVKLPIVLIAGHRGSPSPIAASTVASKARKGC